MQATNAAEVGVRHGRLAEALQASRYFVDGSGPLTTDKGKISLVFSTQGDGPGSLGAVLQLFNKHSVNMTRIESRPALRCVACAGALSPRPSPPQRLPAHTRHPLPLPAPSRAGPTGTTSTWTLTGTPRTRACPP